MTSLPPPSTFAAFDQEGYLVLRDAIAPSLREDVRRASGRLLASDLTHGRDRGADGKDGFRGCVAHDPAFLPLLANPAALYVVTGLLSPNIHVLSVHLIALPSLPAGAQRTIRTAERPGWHRDMYGVAGDIGHDRVPRLAIKCAYYLGEITDDCGVTMVLPSSQHATCPPPIPPGGIDPPGALTPRLGPHDALLFENRTWHAGGLNISSRPRLAIMVQYGYRWLAPIDDPVPELLTDPRLTDIERQLLGAPDRAADGAIAKGSGAAPLRDWWDELNAGCGTREHRQHRRTRRSDAAQAR